MSSSSDSSSSSINSYKFISDENPAHYLDDEELKYCTQAENKKFSNISNSTDEHHSYHGNAEYSSHEESLGHSSHGLYVDHSPDNKTLVHQPPYLDEDLEYSSLHNKNQKYSAEDQYSTDEDYSDDDNLDYSMSSKDRERTLNIESHNKYMESHPQEKKLVSFSNTEKAQHTLPNKYPVYHSRDDNNTEYSTLNENLKYSPPGDDLEYVSEDETSERSIFSTKQEYMPGHENVEYSNNANFDYSLHHEDLKYADNYVNSEHSSHDDSLNYVCVDDNRKYLLHHKNLGYYLDNEHYVPYSSHNEDLTNPQNYRNLEYTPDNQNVLYSSDYENIEYITDGENVKYASDDKGKSNADDKNPEHAPENIEYATHDEHKEYASHDAEYYTNDDEDMEFLSDDKNQQYYSLQVNPGHPSHEELKLPIQVKNQEYDLYPGYLVSSPKDLNLVYIRLDESFKQYVEREYQKYFPPDANHAYFQAPDTGKSRAKVVSQRSGRVPRKCKPKQEHPLLKDVKKILDASKIDYDRDVLSRLTIAAEHMSTKLLQDAIYYSPAKGNDDSARTGLGIDDIKFAIEMECSHEVNVPDEDTRIHAAVDINCNPLSNLIPNETLLPEENLGNTNYRLKDEERGPTETILRMFKRGLKRPMVENPVTIHTIPKAMRKIIITPNFGTVIVPRELLQEGTTMQHEFLS